jgi:hypothetical protein
MIYISGPITGRPIEESEAHFKKASDDLAKADFIPSNPMLLDHNHDKSWQSYMKEDISEMMKCDAIYMLQGWKSSKGAKIEYELAKALGFTIYHEPIFPIFN